MDEEGRDSALKSRDEIIAWLEECREGVEFP